MEHVPPNGEIDRLSDLPEDVLLHILAFLPTKSAAQTSLISRRFRALWEASASSFLNLDDYAYSAERMTPADLVELTDRTLLRCTPLSPLLRLRIRLRFRTGDTSLTTNGIASLLDKVSNIGLRHLSIQLHSYMYMWPTILTSVLLLSSLESLSLDNVLFSCPVPPSSPMNLKHLRSLSIVICMRVTQSREFASESINWLVPQLDALEDLHIRSSVFIDFLNLKSMTLRKLKLELDIHDLRICAPSLELLELKSRIGRSSTPRDWEMPKLRKAFIQLQSIFEENVEVIFKMLNAIANVQELHININESRDQIDTFHAFLLPGVDPPTFFNLKHFNLEICFHEHNIEDLVNLIKHSPALESIKLVHKPPFRVRKDKKKKLWRSQLPRNVEGNYRHAYFEDLHIPKKKEEFLEQLLRKLSSKKPKT